jgi:hypothetical protein
MINHFIFLTAETKICCDEAANTTPQAYTKAAFQPF